MGQIEDLRLFVAIVEQGSIARTAEALGIAKSAVSRRLRQLEDRYDVRLIDRQPRSWEVTTAGQELYQRASELVGDADDLEEDFRQTRQSLSGPLKVTIAREFGSSFLQPMLFAFMQAHPQINLTVDLDDRTIDLETENYDLGVRVTADKPVGLNCIPLARSRHGLFASPKYIEMHGAPETLADLSKRPLLHYGSARRACWDFTADGKKQHITFQPALNSNTGPFLLSAARNNLGITRLPDFVVHDSLQDGSLVQILTEIEITTYNIQAIYSAKRRLNKRMRVFVSALQESCGLLGQNLNKLRSLTPFGVES